MFLGLISSLGSCSQSGSDPKPKPPVVPTSIGNAEVWVTSGDQTMLLSKQSDIDIEALGSSNGYPTITLDSTTLLQEIDGFGAALTGSSAYVINTLMSSAQRSALLKDLFDANDGIGISYLRTTIGASDFSLSNYTYDDVAAGQTDYDLANFSIAKDQDHVIPVLKQIVAVSPAIKIMGTPWSPPAWMKTSGSLKGGKLKTDAYDAYSHYFVKYIRAFKDQGITIDAITPQNEPLYSTANYPCTDMPASEQLDFVKNNLGPLFQTEGIATKIIVYDHNWDQPSYATTILGDATASQYVAGSAFHAYAGNVSAMSTVHTAYPQKGLYFTEISGGAWASNFSDNLQWNMSNIFIGTTKNWSKNALLWNLALNENNGPTNNGCSDCRGVVTIKGDGSVTRNIEYYTIGHMSKFVRPAAHRIASSVIDGTSKLDHVAFMNADGSKALVVLNNDSQQQTFVVKLGNRQFTYTLTALSVATIVWK